MSVTVSRPKTHNELLAEARDNLRSREEQFGSLATRAVIRESSRQEERAQKSSHRRSKETEVATTRISQDVPITI